MGSVVKFKRVHPDARPPEYQTVGASGADLSSVEDVDIPSGGIKLIKTGLSVELPLGIEMQIRPRSGLALKHGVTVLNAPGTIDSDYRGEIGIILVNHGSETFSVSKGQRIAQGILGHVVLYDYEEVDELIESDRAAGGFGSTGRN
jgi:dUTP pyrophosphatase